jgi:hypothetical protein
MTKTKIFLLSFSLFSLCMKNISAQNSTVVSGGNASASGGTGGTVSYTIGMVNYKSSGNGSATITEGMQQPYEISVVNGVEETGIGLVTIYPNPTTDFVMLSLPGDAHDMSYTVSDMQGKVLLKEKLTDSSTDIPMAPMANGTYFVNVFQGKTELKTYKIIKNN